MERRDFLQGVVATCAAPLLSQITTNTAVAAETIWSKGSYLYCDAQLLAGLWNQTIESIKNKITEKVLSGNLAGIEQGLTQARVRYSDQATEFCSYRQNGYDTDDMEALAAFWKIDLQEAKYRANAKLYYGFYDELQKLTKTAHQQVLGHLATARPVDMNTALRPENIAYWSKGDYLYCDAKMIASHWGKPLPLIQEMIENKVRDGASAVVEHYLQQARLDIKEQKSRDLCDYYENGYTFEDMEDLGELWKIDSWDAKGKASRKLFHGQRDQLWRAVKAARKQAIQSRIEAQRASQTPTNKRIRRLQVVNLYKFQKSSYTYCDAAVIAHWWGVPVLEAKRRVGENLRQGNQNLIQRKLKIARSKAVPKAELICSYDIGGYSYKDVKALASEWQVNINQAKSRTSLKLVQGEQESIDRTLKIAHRRKIVGK